MILPCEDGTLETKGEDFVAKCDLTLGKGDCNSASFIEESRGQERETLQEVQWSRPFVKYPSWSPTSRERYSIPCTFQWPVFRKNRPQQLGKKQRGNTLKQNSVGIVYLESHVDAGGERFQKDDRLAIASLAWSIRCPGEGPKFLVSMQNSDRETYHTIKFKKNTDIRHRL